MTGGDILLWLAVLIFMPAVLGYGAGALWFIGLAIFMELNGELR